MIIVVGGIVLFNARASIYIAKGGDVKAFYYTHRESQCKKLV